MIKPISPPEALEACQKRIPSEVIEVFNELIIKHFEFNEVHMQAAFTEQEVISLLKEKLSYEQFQEFNLQWRLCLSHIKNLYELYSWKVFTINEAGDGVWTSWVFKKSIT